MSMNTLRNVLYRVTGDKGQEVCVTEEANGWIFWSGDKATHYWVREDALEAAVKAAGKIKPATDRVGNT